MKKVVLLCLLFLTIGISAQEDKAAPAPRIAIKIPLGETLMLDGMSIQFVEVLEDSRCPKDVVCVWAGQAKVKLMVSRDDVSTPNTKEIIVGKNGENTIAQLDSFNFKAVGLSPYPATENMTKRDYVLLMVKEKIEDQ